ncbi:MAG: hypothetical protein C0483_18635 [Pirellula sp.]|nr:hypothetical protein [Pirellula sp.]
MNTAHHMVRLRGGPFDGEQVGRSPLDLTSELRIAGTIIAEDYVVLTTCVYKIVAVEKWPDDLPEYYARTFLADFVDEVRQPLTLVEAAAR